MDVDVFHVSAFIIYDFLYQNHGDLILQMFM